LSWNNRNGRPKKRNGAGKMKSNGLPRLSRRAEKSSLRLSIAGLNQIVLSSFLKISKREPLI